MWMEETIGKRINQERAEEIIEKKVKNVAVGCPFCLTMIEDGMKELVGWVEKQQCEDRVTQAAQELEEHGLTR